MPRGAKFGYLRRMRRAGTLSPFETVLEADIERASLLAEAETALDPDRLGTIYERLDQIDAYTAPARAGAILNGLGFDEPRRRARWRVFRAAGGCASRWPSLLFTNPDLLLLDEPSNHLDLEAVMWLEGFSARLSRHHPADQPRARSAQQCRRSYPASR